MRLLQFEFSDARELSRRGALVDLDESDQLTTVVRILHTHHRHQLLGCDLIVVRPPVMVPRAAAVQGDEASPIAELASRFPTTTLALLTSREYRHELSGNLSSECSATEGLNDISAQIIRQIRQREMENFVEQSGAMLPRSRSFNYRLPANVFADSFLRVGNIQTHRDVLDAVFFWLIPSLRAAHGLLVDTWSISSIALNAARLLARYDAAKREFRVEMLAHYYDGRPGTRSVLDEIARRVSGDYRTPFLVLFSASMTGQSLSRVARSLDIAKCPAGLAAFQVVYRLKATPIEIKGEAVPELCDLSKIIAAPSGAPALPERRTSIEIDPITYFPRTITEREQRILKAVADRHRAFFDAYRQDDIIRVHATSYIGGQRYRHHGVLIDVRNMFRVEGFRRNLAQAAGECDPPPTMIISPTHEAARAMTAFIREELFKSRGLVVPSYVSIDLSSGPIVAEDDAHEISLQELSRQLQQRAADDVLLVVDDVVTTGQRLLTYQRRLRDLGYRGRTYYLVAVSRMSSALAWTGLCATLRVNMHSANNVIRPVEQILLPDWDDFSCPWCLESKLLDDIISANGERTSTFMRERANRLRSADRDGLADDVFLEGMNLPPMALTPNSVMVSDPASQAAVFAAVACTLQEMRTERDEDKRLAPDGFPLRSILTIDDLKDRYTDPILRAAILRAAYARELNRAQESAEALRTDWAQRCLKSGDEADRLLRRELLLNVLLDKFSPRVLDKQLLETLRAEGFAELCDMIAAGSL